MNDLASPATIPPSRKLRPRGMTLYQAINYEIAKAFASNGCLLAPNPNCYGYRKMPWGHTTLPLHRLILERKLGRTLDKNEQTRHICHRRNCINPDHLIPGSPLDNSMDMVRAGRNFIPDNRGERCAMAKLTERDVQEIRAKYATGSTSHRKLAKMYGISHQEICRVVNRQDWRHI